MEDDFLWENGDINMDSLATGDDGSPDDMGSPAGLEHDKGVEGDGEVPVPELDDNGPEAGVSRGGAAAGAKSVGSEEKDIDSGGNDSKHEVDEGDVGPFKVRSLNVLICVFVCLCVCVFPLVVWCGVVQMRTFVVENACRSIAIDKYNRY